MTTSDTKDIRVRNFEPLPPPMVFVSQQPIDESLAAHVTASRSQIRAALDGRDPRLLVIVGPCSIHDEGAALEYAEKLANLQAKIEGQFLILMRVYFEKPRTTVGWKGLINDPHLDGTHDIVYGLTLARRILLKVNRLGLACATEFLDPITPQYTADLVAWTAIGARTTESQTHRQMASGLSMPVGFKNATDGGLQVAADAMVSARHGHAFLGIDMDGRTSIVNTAGNPDVHLVLRGGGGKPNYSPTDIAKTRSLLGERARQRSILIDCSHGNSNKDYMRQPLVFKDVLQQVLDGESTILGMMLESNLIAGNQKVGDAKLIYGQSITDGCIDWQATEELLIESASRIGA